MKRLILFTLFLLILFFFSFPSFAQVPQLFNYQGIARDTAGNVLPNRMIGVQLSILDGGAAGTVVYSESFTDTTNAFGLFAAQVGGGMVTSGNFSTINWVTGNKYLQTAIDLNGGTNYSLSGTTQLLSVPYALYAQKVVESVSGAWNLNGNTGSADSNFIGTTGPISFTVKVNDSLSGKIDPVNFNTYWGYNSGSARGTGIQNTAMGYQTLNNITAGSYNTAVGGQVLSANSTGLYNTAIGDAALRSNTIGSYNTALGFGTLTDNISGIQNSAGGYLSLFFNTTGNDNTAFGFQALQNNTTGNDNTAIGRQALASNRTGYGNVALGSQALGNNVYGKQLIAIGDSALYSFQGMDDNGNTQTYNLAIGAMALFSNTFGFFNVAIGGASLEANIDGFSNVAVGAEAMEGNTHGLGNTALGADALASNTTGNNNTVVGSAAMFATLNGNGNTAVGNRAFGINYRADQALGNGNTALGDSADVSAGGLNNATAIGSGTIVDASNKVRIGNTAVTVIEGQVPFTTPSDGRFKFNIKEDVKGLDFILRLRPVTYQFNTKLQDEFVQGVMNTDPSCSENNVLPTAYDEAMGVRRTGFIAQEVEQAARKAGYNFDGINVPRTDRQYYSLSYSSFVVPLVKAIQEQQDTILGQQRKLAVQNRDIKELSREVAALAAQLAEIRKQMIDNGTGHQ